jgi:adenine-specific DNA-methyltransferase
MSIKKLELSWYDKDTELKVEPRILILNNELSYSKVVKKDLFDEDGYQQNDNMLIHGDNLIALKSLE